MQFRNFSRFCCFCRCADKERW